MLLAMAGDVKLIIRVEGVAAPTTLALSSVDLLLAREIPTDFRRELELAAGDEHRQPGDYVAEVTLAAAEREPLLDVLRSLIHSGEVAAFPDDLRRLKREALRSAMTLH